MYKDNSINADEIKFLIEIYGPMTPTEICKLDEVTVSLGTIHDMINRIDCVHLDDTGRYHLGRCKGNVKSVEGT